MTGEGHISDDDLERLVLRMVTDEAEREHLEEHLLGCGACRRRGRVTRRECIRTGKVALPRPEPVRKPMGKARPKKKGA